MVDGGLWGGRLAVVGRHDGGNRAFLGNSTCLFVLGRLVLPTRQWWQQDDDVHVHFWAHTVLFLALRGLLTHETTYRYLHVPGI